MTKAAVIKKMKATKVVTECTFIMKKKYRRIMEMSYSHESHNVK